MGDVATVVQEVASRYEIPVLDMYNNGKYELEMYDGNSDGVHPSQEFIREYTAPQIVQFIEENYSVNESVPDDDLDSETNASDVDFSTLTYATIGDSITYGFCGDHSLPPFNKNYPNSVKNLLCLKAVYNYGACGCLLSRHTNSAYTSMIDKIDLVPSGTDIVSVFGGINDFSTYVPLGDINSTDEYTIYGALNAIAFKLTENYKDAFVFFVTPLNLSDGILLDINNTDYSILDVCFAIKAVGEKWEIPVFDANVCAGFDPDLHSFDGCHPTEAFYSAVLAPKLAQFIRENYK